ncbi:MAG: RsmE family RNA methyltransferase [Acidimicrobiales bacterium]|nr:RsmE family RNA methyltransferase [Acidimicrobiales bacterium]MDG2218604.1 RsmE family RNA methyltransferase [Acidimicrobiales bacterium]
MSTGDPLPDGSHGPHVLVDDLDVLDICVDDRHHLDRVLRVRDGDPITIGDGRGGWQPFHWGSMPTPVGERCQVDAPAPRVGVAFALIKGGRPELVVQKLTELGVDDIRPFVAARSVVRWDADKATRNAERLSRVAREAVMQCRRAWIPTVHDVTDFAGVAELHGAAMAERGGAPIDGETTLLIGPEGGWDNDERAAAIPRIALSDAVLRAETAAICAGVVLVASRSH